MVKEAGTNLLALQDPVQMLDLRYRTRQDVTSSSALRSLLSAETPLKKILVSDTETMALRPAW